MNFHDFRVDISEHADDVVLKFEDDFEAADWYSPQDLVGRDIGPATLTRLREMGFLQ